MFPRGFAGVLSKIPILIARLSQGAAPCHKNCTDILNHTLDIYCCCIISVSSTAQWAQKGVWLFWVQLQIPELSSLKCVNVKQELDQQQARQHCQQRRVAKREYVENMMAVFGSSSNQCHCPKIAVITSSSNQCQECYPYTSSNQCHDCRGPLKNGRGLSWASSLKVKEW